MVVGSPPTVRRRQLARLLRATREEAGWKAEDVASEMRSSASRISRIETARVKISPGAVHEICDVLEVEGDQRYRLVQLARTAEKPGWWQEYTDKLSYEYSTYISLEDEAASLRWFEPLVVPGMLQTEEYARALIRKGLVEGTAEEVEDRVTARLTRQRVLTREENPLRVSFILDEAALRRAVGGREVMKAQLRRLSEAAELSNVRIQAIPFGAGAHACTTGPFTILGFPETADPDVVYLENAAGDLYVEKQPGVRRYNLVFEDLRADALGHDESAALITRIADDFGRR